MGYENEVDREASNGMLGNIEEVSEEAVGTDTDGKQSGGRFDKFLIVFVLNIWNFIDLNE